MNSIHMPSSPNVIYLNPLASKEDRDKQLKEMFEKFDQALEYLSTPSPKKPKTSSDCFEPICVNAVCDTGCYIVNNVGRIARDALCFWSESCTNPPPEHKTWMPKNVRDKMISSKVKYHVNIVGLLCWGPLMVFAAALIPGSTAVKLGLGILADLVIIQVTGTDTYLCSGDYGIQNQNGVSVLEGGHRVMSIIELKEVYHTLANYMDQKWEKGAYEDIELLKKQARGICDNWELIREEFGSMGINEMNTNSILAPFANILNKINDSQGPIHQRPIIGEFI